MRRLRYLWYGVLGTVYFSLLLVYYLFKVCLAFFIGLVSPQQKRLLLDQVHRGLLALKADNQERSETIQLLKAQFDEGLGGQA